MSTSFSPEPHDTFLPQAKVEHPAAAAPNYLNVAYGVRSWLLTKDHKRIACSYLISITLMFFIGGAAATLIRLQLMTPTSELVRTETYNKLFTMHGVIMVFFFLIPSIPSVLGNFFVPMMIGAKDLAFPRLNLLSWYIYLIGAALTLWAIISGGTDTGWTFYTPVQHDLVAHQRPADGPGNPHQRLLFDPHRFEFHRDDPSHAGAGTDLVSAAAVHLVDLRHVDHLPARHAGAGHGAGACCRRADAAHRHLRSGAGRRSGAVSAFVLVLFASGRVHHDPAGHGSRQRSASLLRRGNRPSATRRSRSRASASP